MFDFTTKVYSKFQRHKQSDNNQTNLKDANPLSLSNTICKSMANINWSKNTKAPHSLISSIINEYKNSVAPLKQSLGWHWGNTLVTLTIPRGCLSYPLGWNSNKSKIFAVHTLTTAAHLKTFLAGCHIHITRNGSQNADNRCINHQLLVLFSIMAVVWQVIGPPYSNELHEQNSGERFRVGCSWCHATRLPPVVVLCCTTLQQTMFDPFS